MNNLRTLAAIVACFTSSFLAHAAGGVAGGVGGEFQELTSATVSASPNRATSAAAIRLEATVSPPVEGLMKFVIDGQLIQTVPVTAGADSCPSDPTSAPTLAKVAMARLKAQPSTAKVAATATSACGDPFGTVTFTVSPGTLSVGDHALTARFVSSSPDYTGSVSDALILTISAAPLPPVPVSPTPVSSFEYDAEGYPTKTVVAPATKAFATQHGYDPLGRRTTTTDAKSGLTRFSYDLRDELNSVTDPRQLVTQYQPNGLGDVTTLTSPDTGTTSNTFDAAGNLRTRTDARGVLATYTYDALNRATQVVFSKTGSTSRPVTWTYDQTGAAYGYGVGRLTSAATPDASTTWRYDALGRVTSQSQTATAGSTLTVGTGYDNAGHVTSLTYPSGRSVTFAWANGQPTSISTTAGTTTTLLLDQIVVSPFGPLQSWVWQLGSARPHERVYDSSGRMVRHPLGLLVRDITYDDADRISRYTHYNAATSLPAQAYDQAFGYDELDRLITATGSTNWTYGYDANGNRTAAAAGVNARGYGVSATSNRLDTLSAPLRSLSYDATGNVLSDIQSGSGANYMASYSLEGRLAAMTQGSSAGVDFGYDALGRRVLRGQWMGSPSNPRAYTLYAYDTANHLIGEYQADGTPITEYIWLGDTPVAVIKTSGITVQVYAVHADHLDTPRVLMDASGQMRWRWLGEPFGASLAEEQPTVGLTAVQQNLRFPGQQYEPFGGRYYNFFRDYDPTIGRYVQSDPIGLDGGINSYAYVQGNPVSLADPLGLDPWWKTPSYPTADDAGTAAACYCKAQEKKQNIERGNWIRKDSMGNYVYDKPVDGTRTNIPSFPGPPEDPQGWFHNHPYTPGYEGEFPSAPDRSNTNANMAPGYLATPAGQVIKFSPRQRWEWRGTYTYIGSCQ